MGEKRKYIRSVYPEDIEKINSQNKDLLDKFLVGKRNLSDTTRNSYSGDILAFLVYILKHAENKHLFDIDVEEMAEIIDDYISYCSIVLGNSERRLARRTSSISSLYIFYKKRRKAKENPVELLERVKATSGQYVTAHVFLSAEQVEKIRSRLRENSNIPLELYFELALFTMARINALCSIRLNQVDLEKKIIVGVVEKEGYVVNLYFSDRVKTLIGKWLAERSQIGIESELLLCTKRGSDIKSTIQTTYTQTLSEYAGVKGVTAHCLRRSGSDLRKKAGMTLEDISKLLNHKSTAVTQAHYVQADYEKLREEVDRYDI